ncbi:helix-turn-helix domain-containing protein [Lactobacillus helveticus]|uniref:helix-turn-helix domain-containing protein n=1 Tax=Lactobacillus helveticus TaxID=1587 RepID=UPI002181FB11|nr:helix-turn-helix domain-containing protein [Lactobacillus helveticus]
MKSEATKQKFIQLRAEGLSYAYAKIGEQLNISKGTCSKWEDQLTDEIADLKKDHLQELYEEYGMQKEARIKALGKVLNKIDDAIDDADFSAMTPAQLLDARLKYQKALNNEYVPNY